MFKSWPLIIMWLLSITVYANESPQIVPFQENEKIELSLSPSAYNKIFIANEKITNFHFVNGDFVIADTNDMDEFIPQDDGSIYIVPLTDKKPIVYLTTNKGHHVALEVNLRDGSGQVVKLAFGKLSTPKVKPVTIKKSVNEIVLKALVEGKVPVGFHLDDTVQSDSYALPKQIELKMIRSFSSKGQVALIYQAQNQSNVPISITPEFFSNRGTKALTLSANRLNPHESLYIYTLRETNHA